MRAISRLMKMVSASIAMTLLSGGANAGDADPYDVLNSVGLIGDWMPNCKAPISPDNPRLQFFKLSTSTVPPGLQHFPNDPPEDPFKLYVGDTLVKFKELDGPLFVGHKILAANRNGTFVDLRFVRYRSDANLRLLKKNDGTIQEYELTLNGPTVNTIHQGKYVENGRPLPFYSKCN